MRIYGGLEVFRCECYAVNGLKEWDQSLRIGHSQHEESKALTV
jgi:hypothetical protein